MVIVSVVINKSTWMSCLMIYLNHVVQLYTRGGRVGSIEVSNVVIKSDVI